MWSRTLGELLKERNALYQTNTVIYDRELRDEMNEDKNKAETLESLLTE